MNINNNQQQIRFTSIPVYSKHNVVKFPPKIKTAIQELTKNIGKENDKFLISVPLFKREVYWNGSANIATKNIDGTVSFFPDGEIEGIATKPIRFYEDGRGGEFSEVYRDPNYGFDTMVEKIKEAILKIGKDLNINK